MIKDWLLHKFGRRKFQHRIEVYYDGVKIAGSDLGRYVMDDQNCTLSFPTTSPDIMVGTMLADPSKAMRSELQKIDLPYEDLASKPPPRKTSKRHSKKQPKRALAAYKESDR